MSPDASAPDRRLRILFLTWRDGDHPESGGAETYVERTSQVLASRGHRVTVFSALFPGAPRSVERGRVQIIRGGGRFTCYARGLQFLKARGREFDVVIDIQNGVPFWSPIVTRIPVATIVHHVHKEQWPIIFGPRWGAAGWFLESRVAPRIYRRSRYITVSQATRTELEGLGIPRHRIDITYSGNDHPPDLHRYALLPRSPEPSLMVLGRLVPHKHVEVAIDTVAALSNKYPGLILDVVGQGYWEDELRRYAQRSGVEGQVRFHGFVSDESKRELLSRSWVVIMPSQKEGWGLTIVEAGLHATPCVAFSYAGGVTESLIDGETGLLANDGSQMIAHVDALLGHPDLRRRMGENARQHAERFTWEETGRQLERVLLRASETAGPPQHGGTHK